MKPLNISIINQLLPYFMEKLSDVKLGALLMNILHSAELFVPLLS